MGCTSCSTKNTDGVPAGCGNKGACASGSCNKLNVFDWLSNMALPTGSTPFPILEVRFKNGRKDFYRSNEPEIFQQGDIIAVEASPGHDIGIVSLSGELVRLQMKKRNLKADDPGIRAVFRKAKQADIEKWQSAREQEVPTMFKARQIAQDLKLQMKLSDVEFQGDKTKAVFYYTAEERVDFRELIKKLADEFKIRVEMRQIGSRQEASRLGGIGSCGRELCCSTWLTDFRSVSTSAARYQQLSLNPSKLAGQCGKLKCCLNYELDSYMDALKAFPQVNEKIQTKKGVAFHQKTDIFRKILWYSYADDPSNFIALDLNRVKFLIQSNKEGIVPESLIDEAELKLLSKGKGPDFENVVGQDSLTRFDNLNKTKKKKKRKKPSDKSSVESTGDRNEPPSKVKLVNPQNSGNRNAERPAETIPKSPSNLINKNPGNKSGNRNWKDRRGERKDPNATPKQDGI